MHTLPDNRASAAYYAAECGVSSLGMKAPWRLLDISARVL